MPSKFTGLLFILVAIAYSISVELASCQWQQLGDYYRLEACSTGDCPTKDGFEDDSMVNLHTSIVELASCQ
ncbi:MAG: hypothetical protein F6K41_07380 [Symploca sp. SIO3E6]|nr:hypothetical protein [Caldora sp. SIO3E6]